MNKQTPISTVLRKFMYAKGYMTPRFGRIYQDTHYTRSAKKTRWKCVLDFYQEIPEADQDLVKLEIEQCLKDAGQTVNEIFVYGGSVLVYNEYPIVIQELDTVA